MILMSDRSKVDFFEKQISLENRIVKVAERSVKDTKNVLVRELIRGIALDSKKHERMLSALVGKYAKSTPLLDETLTRKLEKDVKEHIELEEKALNTYRELLKDLTDEAEKVIVNAIINDETRHHELLKGIHKMIVEKETLTEKDMWDWIWKDAPFHGSPGGG